nr:neuroglian-like [Rhipicephalus microplus]
MAHVPALLLLLGAVVAGAVVPSPPTMVKQPKHEQLYQVSQSQDELDKPFLLECEAQGHPEPTYEWTKNNKEFDYVSYDKRISQQPRRGTLVFTKPDDVDEGLYQCRATNLHGTSVSNAVFLRKAELNNFAEETTKEVYVVEGDPLSLDCNPPTGYPRPNIFWLIQYSSGALRNVNSSRITADPEGDLHFSRVELGDALSDAVYTCSATSVFRREYKIGNKIQLKVEPTSSAGKAEHAPVKQYLSPPNLVALRGHELKLYCVYGGTPLPQISWSKRGSNPTSRRFTYSNYGKTLEIRSVSFEDEGTYECQANNGVGVAQTHAMHVKVEAAPYWLRVPDNTNAAEEESVSFECAATGIPEPKLQWFVNGVPVEKAEPNPRRKVEGTLLTIEALTKRDTAVYQCNASNPHGYAFRDFYLNVLALPPTITEAPEQLTLAVVTSRVTLRCRVFGAPRPEVKWMKEAQELTGGRYRVLDSGDLQIDDLLVTDQGEYTCYASNKFGDASASGSLEVKGKTLITQPPENYEVAADKSATFRCNAEADPSLELKIEWLFNGQPVDPEADARMVQAGDNSLTITRTIELDSGIYTCVARTELDSDRAQATLTVQDVPNPPQMVRIDCDGLMALVEWKPTGDRRAPILSYSIQYNTSFSPDTWEDAFVNIPAPDTKFKVSMSPWANYTFRVVARNKIGPSLPSGASSRCTTPEDVPHKNPDRVMGRGDRFDNLLITWTPMPPIEHNAPGFFYKVLWKRDDIPDATWSSRIIEDWKLNRHVEYGQPTFKPYRIKVEAHNRRGQAHTAATEVIGYSGENVPLAAPQDFKLANVVDARTANFTWSPVSPESVRGHFRGYKIQTWTPDEGEEKLREVVVPANVTTATVSLFRPFSRNLVHVLVFNDMYNGPPSDSIEFSTPEGVPGPVASFEGIPMGSTGIYLLWKRPLETNGVLTGYHIYYEEVRGTQLGPKMERQPPVRDPLESRAKLAGLKPRTKYRITIHAATAQGQGDPNFIELETADESERVPDMPDFTWAYLPDRDGHAAVQVTWLPAMAGHPGSHFYVQYRRKGDETWETTMVEKNEDNILVKGLETGALYEMRVIAVDGKHQRPSRTEEVETGGLAIRAPGSPDAVAGAAWFIGMMCALALLLLLLILVCLVKRNRGGKYSVHDKEVAQGRDLDYDGGFHEYTKPAQQAPVRGSRTSLHSSTKESDSDSMAEYGEGDPGQFGEDGSFIGEYGPKQRRQLQQLQQQRPPETTSPSALATFV